VIRSNSVPVRWRHMTKAALLPAVLLLFAAGNAFGAVQYGITDLGTLGGIYSLAYAINDSGQVVGESVTSNGYTRAFLYSGSGPMQDLGTLGGASSKAFGINNSGQVVGTAPLSSGRDHAFLYSGGGPMQDLGTLSAPGFSYSTSEARGINNSGQVVGGGLYNFYGPVDYRAFLYSGNGSMIDLGKPIGSYGAEARAINDSGQVVGNAFYSGSYDTVTRAFFYGGDGGPMQDLGTLGFDFGIMATAINNSGQVVGSATAAWYPDCYASHAFLYSGNGPMKDLGTLTTPNLVYASSSASGINDSGQVVGRSTPLRGDYPPHAFLYTGDGPMQDLNDLVVPSSAWTLTEATAINNKGQIVGYGTNPAAQTHAFLLTPLLNPASRTYTATAPPTTTNPTDRLAEWNGTSWVPVAAGSISDDVHVLVHGWAPGERDWVDSNGGSDARVWNATTAAGTNWFQPFTDLANSIKTHSGDRVLAYSWIDGAATEDELGAMDIYAAQSAVLAGVAGGPLKKALEAAIGPNDVNLQLIGHSHGAKVATLATQQLVQSGIPVKQLSLFDSPEQVFGSTSQLVSSTLNSLDSYLSTLPIGNGPNKTFVDNYFTTFGREYGGNVVNVALDGPYDFRTNHGYPIEWYSDSATKPNPGQVGIDWSPLTGDAGESLSTNQWKQAWRDFLGFPDPDHELDLVPETSTPSPAFSLKRLIADLKTAYADSNVTGLPNGFMLFTKDSPAFWDSTFTKSDGDVAMQFSYEFIQPGQGDQLGVWVDNQLRFIVTGEFAGTGQQIGAFDISDLTPGSHGMTVALLDYGSDPAQFSIGDFAVLSVPEPSTLVMGFTGVVCLLLLAWRHRRRT